MRLLPGQWYGKTLNKHCVEGLTLSETSYGSNLKLPRHSHERSYFCFVVKGTYTESYCKTEQTCKASTLIYHPADESHSNHFHADSRCFNIQMDDMWMERMRQHSIMLNEPGYFQDGVPPHLATRLYDEFCKSDEYKKWTDEREFRANLSQIVFTSDPKIAMAWSEILRRNIGLSSQHGRAVERMMKIIVAWMEKHAAEISGLDTSRPMLPQFDLLSGEQIKAIFIEADPMASDVVD
jgi:hypothetical protein